MCLCFLISWSVTWLALSSHLSSLHHYPLSLPSFPPLSSTHHLPDVPSQMLGGQDWSFVGPSLQHHGGGASARCLLAYSFQLHKSEESMQQMRGGTRWKAGGALQFASHMHFWSLSIFVSTSHSSSSFSILSEFWITFGRVWLVGDGFLAQGKVEEEIKWKPLSVGVLLLL